MILKYSIVKSILSPFSSVCMLEASYIFMLNVILMLKFILTGPPVQNQISSECRENQEWAVFCKLFFLHPSFRWRKNIVLTGDGILSFEGFSSSVLPSGHLHDCV